MAQAVAKQDEAGGQVVAADAATLMEVISRAAKDPGVDVDKLERLMQMAERLQTRSAEQAFNLAMKDCQAEMPRILKNKKNTHTSSTYADLDAVIKAITPIYTKHGFGLSFGTADGAPADHYRVTCLVSHEAGFSREYHADIPADTKGAKGNDTKTATHGFGSSMSYGRRYLTLLIFNISTTDDDGNSATGTIDDAQYAVLDALVQETRADLRKFLLFMGVDALWAIPASKFNQAKRALEAKRAKT
jgi:hypothetical protein